MRELDFKLILFGMFSDAREKRLKDKADVTDEMIVEDVLSRLKVTLESVIKDYNKYRKDEEKWRANGPF